MLKLLPLAVVAAILTGCATPRFVVDIKPATRAKPAGFNVVDGRDGQEIDMNFLGFGGQAYVYTLVPAPGLAEALQSRIDLAAAGAHAKPATAMTVTIEDIVLKNRTGFATVDELSCRIESTVPAATPGRIRTSITDKTNMSPFITTTGQLILNLCLVQHAADIIKAVGLAPGR